MSLLEPIEERPGEGSPELSVLMPVYNTAPLVGAAVASVLDQQGCIAEILISDDQSPDATLEAVRKTVSSWRGRHHVRVFRTTRRLAIDHVDALVSIATGPLLVQAHGDDRSRRDRLAKLLELQRQNGAALLSSLARLRYGSKLADEQMPEGWRPGWVSLEDMFDRPPGYLLSGARIAVDRRVWDLFPRLNSAHLRAGHDWLQSFRATLLGGAWLSPERLVLTSRWPGQWSQRMADRSVPDATMFGFFLMRLDTMRALGRDLEHAETHATVPAARIEEARRVLQKVQPAVVNQLLEAMENLRKLGLLPQWVTEESLAEANLQLARARGTHK